MRLLREGYKAFFLIGSLSFPFHLINPSILAAIIRGPFSGFDHRFLPTWKLDTQYPFLGHSQVPDLHTQLPLIFRLSIKILLPRQYTRPTLQTFIWMCPSQRWIQPVSSPISRFWLCSRRQRRQQTRGGGNILYAKTLR
jgi:hypothetical protein